MAIMNKMRDNTHVILFFLLVMFVASMTIGGLVGGANIMDLLSGKKPDTIIMVNGDEVSYDQFYRAYQSEIESYRQRSGSEPNSYQIQQIEEQVYESFISDILRRQKIEELGIGVTDEEIKYHIFDNPHQLFTTDQNFWNEEQQFDLERYQTALASPGNDQFWQYKEQYLRMLLPYEKLDKEILSTIRVTENEVKDEFIRKNQKASVDYILFDANSFNVPDSIITDDEIRSFYKENEDEYREEEKRRIRYVTYSTSPSAADSAGTIKFANSLLDSARNGADFAILAETYSDDAGSAEKGGDLGFFGRGSMVKPFEEAAFSASKGDIVGPIESNFGLHIIKVEDRKREDGEEKVKARHILLKFNASRTTQEIASENADYFAEQAPDIGFMTLADEEKAKVDSTDFFTTSGFIPGLGMQKRVAMRAFNQKMNEPSKVYFLDNIGYVVFEVFEIKEEGLKSLEDVEAQIKRKIRREKQFELAEKDAQDFREKIQMPEDFERLASTDSLQIKTAESFTREGTIPGVGRDVKFAGTAFALDVNEVSHPVKGSRGLYIIKMKNKEDVNQAAFEAQKESLKNQLLDTKRQAAYSSWLASIKESANIKDYRHTFF